MVGETSGDALPPLEAHNSAYYSNLNLGFLKNRPLLDMQFEDCRQRTRAMRASVRREGSCP